MTSLICAEDLTMIGKRTFPGQPVSIGECREWVATLLDGSDESEMTILLLSEVTTNAIVHTRSGDEGGRIEVRIATSPTRIVVEVLDEGSDVTTPCVRPTDRTSTGGRGLMLVDAIASKWGCATYGDAGVVWFEVPRHE